MTVKELIEKLQEIPENAKVNLWFGVYSGGMERSDIETIEYDEKNHEVDINL